MKVWTWLERAPAPWPAEGRLLAQRAHFLAETRPGFILVEYISGEQEEWPLAECRVLGTTASAPQPTAAR